DRLVTDGQALGDRILALENMDVGAADRRRGDADQRIERPDLGNRLLVEHDAVRFDEDRGFHLLRHGGHSNLEGMRRCRLPRNAGREGDLDQIIESTDGMAADRAGTYCSPWPDAFSASGCGMAMML